MAYPTDEQDLGAMVAGPQQQGGGWTELLNDPVRKSALLSFGLQAMTGGWGNGTQQLAAALGAGASGAAGTAKSLQEQQAYEQQRTDKLGESAENRASREREAGLNRTSREEIAATQVAGRLEVAQERVKGMLERAQLIHGPQNDREMKLFSDARQKYWGKEKDNQLLSKKTDDQIRAEADAWAKEQLRQARDVVGNRSQGSPLPGEVPLEDIKPSGQPKATPKAEGPKPNLESLLSGAKGSEVKALLGTIEGQKRILKDRPDLAGEVEEYNRRAGASPYAKFFGYKTPGAP